MLALLPWYLPPTAPELMECCSGELRCCSRRPGLAASTTPAAGDCGSGGRPCMLPGAPPGQPPVPPLAGAPSSAQPGELGPAPEPEEERLQASEEAKASPTLRAAVFV